MGDDSGGGTGDDSEGGTDVGSESGSPSCESSRGGTSVEASRGDRASITRPASKQPVPLESGTLD